LSSSGLLIPKLSRSLAVQPRAAGLAVPADAAARLPLEWWLLALLALGASTVCAVILIVARLPSLALGPGVFRTALVLHVDLAVLVWFLAVAAGLWNVAAPRHGRRALAISRGGAGLAGGGVAAMLLAPLLGEPRPILANYVPLLDGWLFFFGLAVFLGGVCLAAGAAGAAVAGRRGEPGLAAPWQRAVGAAGLAFGLAVAVFLLAQAGAGPAVTLEERLWGGGHVLQIVHSLMLMGAWLYLGAPALQQLAVGHRLVSGLIALELLAALADLALSLVFPVDSPEYRQGFTEVMRWASWPAPVCLALGLLVGYRRLARTVGWRLGDVYVVASIALFGLGCLVGAGIRGETTAVPAHYHGTVGAVTLAYMVWARCWLERLALPLGGCRLWRWQPLIYGAGIALMVLGLAWAGGLGVPRKAPQLEALASGPPPYLAMSLAGLGGLLATAGSGLFVISILGAIRKKRKA